MDYELLFIGGVCLWLLAFVSFIGAWVESRRPVTAIIFFATGLALIIVVGRERPQGMFSLEEIPTLITRVVARLLSVF